MLWKEISLICSKADSESIEDQLLELGACSVTYADAEDNPILESGISEMRLWQQIQLTALFTEDADLDLIQQALINTFPHTKSLLHSREFADEVWERACMKDFHPIQINERLWVCPSWSTPPNPNAVNLLLDPGLAFGTGSHETTFLCLHWLAEHITHQHAVIDYGCGSGILAIAAAKLGAAHTLGIDVDPQAITATQDNAQKNGLGRTQLKAYLTDEVPQEATADIVVANILANVLIDLYTDIHQKVNAQGQIVLSGILRSQYEEVLACYSQGFTMKAPVFKNDWVLLSGRKK